MKGAVNTGLRFLRALSRPSKTSNTRLLRARGESASSLVIRDAASSDIPALARLHVTTWNATHSWRQKGPTYELRERPWGDTFHGGDGSAAEAPQHELPPGLTRSAACPYFSFTTSVNSM
jgi:hypothetical protein